jgi:hypothetical protein
MKMALSFIALALFLGCASTPDMPGYETARGKTCAKECQQEHSECMQLDVRPDYLVMSPRKRACGKMLSECYQSCLEKEKRAEATSTP